ncbi:MAG: 2-oxo acid dehydrogenase subunit E2, partial [Trebonia sp.]
FTMPVARTEQVTLPSIGESVTEATVLEVHVAVGDTVREADTLVEVSTDKVDVEVPAPTAGRVITIAVEAGDTVGVGEVLVVLESDDTDDEPGESPPPAPSTETAVRATGPAPVDAVEQPRTRASRWTPVAARVAQAHGIDAHSIELAGDGGKVTKDLVLQHVQRAASASAASEVPMRGPEAAVARHMNASRSVPTATTMREVPASGLVAARGRLKNARPGLTYTHLIAWAIVKAAGAVPNMTHRFAEIDDKPVRIRDEAVHLGVAVDVERGSGVRMVLVPVLRSAERMDFSAFVRNYDDLVKRAQSGDLSADELVGANLVLSNTGGFGSTTGVPRLLADHSAIIAVGTIGYPAALRRLAADDERVDPTLWLACTYDHRVVQGADSGRFLGTVDAALQGEQGFFDDALAAVGAPSGASPPGQRRSLHPRRLRRRCSWPRAFASANSGHAATSEPRSIHLTMPRSPPLHGSRLRS